MSTPIKFECDCRTVYDPPTVPITCNLCGSNFRPVEERIPITCGWCGVELPELSTGHICDEGMRVSRAIRDRDASHILDGDSE